MSTVSTPTNTAPSLPSNPGLFAYFGHHKCATNWIMNNIQSITAELKLDYAVVDYPEDFGSDLGKFVKDKHVDFLMYMNADGDYIKTLPSFRGFHIVRDPRDIVVSAYFSHRFSHKEVASEIVEYRRALENMTDDEGLLYVIDHRAEQFREMGTWDYNQPNVLEVRMEDIIENPYKGWLEIGSFLGFLDDSKFVMTRRAVHFLNRTMRGIEIKTKRRIGLPILMNRLPAERLLGIVWDHDFKKMAKGRKPGEENKASHYRKGVSGDWRNHFKPQHIEYFKQKYNPLLLKLGYEVDADWH
jgi:hypothetical protein